MPRGECSEELQRQESKSPTGICKHLGDKNHGREVAAPIPVTLSVKHYVHVKKLHFRRKLEFWEKDENLIKWSKNYKASSITCKELATNLEEKITMDRDLNTEQAFEAVSFLTFP